MNSSTALGGNETPVQNRINDGAAVVLDGGTFSLLGADSTLTTETVGSLNVASGASTIQLQNGSAGTTSLSFGSLVNRNAAATLAFNGTNLGTTNKILFNTGFISGTQLGGWATVNGTDFAKYDALKGVIPFASSDYSINSFNAGSNIYLDPSVSSPAVPASVGTVSIATLNLNATSGSIAVNQNAGTTLTFSNSGLIKSGTNAARRSAAGPSTAAAANWMC